MSQYSTLKNFAINEAAKGLLKYNYEIYPYEWKGFTDMVLTNTDRRIKLSKDENGDQLIHNADTVIARYDEMDMKIYTSIEKRDFHLAKLDQKFNQLKKYFK